MVQQGIVFVGCTGAQFSVPPLLPLGLAQLGFQPVVAHLFNARRTAEVVGGLAHQHHRPTLLEKVVGDANGMSRLGESDHRPGRSVRSAHDARIHRDASFGIEHGAASGVEQRLVFHGFHRERHGLKGVKRTVGQLSPQPLQKDEHASQALRIGVGHAAPRPVPSCATVDGEQDQGFTSLNDGAANDLLRFCRAVAGEFSAALDGMDDVHAFTHRSKDGVVAVEPGCGHRGQEELGAAGVATGVGHGEYTGFVVLESESGRFAGDLPARAAGTRTTGHGVFRMRAAALNHEILDDSVKVETVVVTHVHEFDEIGHGVGGTAVEEVNGDVAGAGFHENLHGVTIKRHFKRICLR